MDQHEDATSKATGFRFLSFTNDKKDAEREAKLKEAAAVIERAIEKDKSLSELIDFNPEQATTEIDPANDTRPLFERLLEQKNKKKEEHEESHKLSNLVMTLDEDEAAYLDEVARSKKEEEVKKQLEIYDILEQKKRLDQTRDLESERKLKMSLLNPKKSNKSSFSKSKLSLAIKIKPKRPSTDLVDTNPMESETSKRQKTEDTVVTHQANECNCDNPKTTKCIGVLPSLPLTNKNTDTSDDSSISDDDLGERIVPRTRTKNK